MASSAHAPEPRTLRSFFHKRLAALAQELGGTHFAALATEDGLLIATHESLEPDPTDRRGAVIASLSAVARAAGTELEVNNVQRIEVEGAAGRLLVLPFVTQQDSGPKRRLLYVVLPADADTEAALGAMQQLIAAIAARFTNE